MVPLLGLLCVVVVVAALLSYIERVASSVRSKGTAKPSSSSELKVSPLIRLLHGFMSTTFLVEKFMHASQNECWLGVACVCNIWKM